MIENESIAILKYFQDVQYFCAEKVISQNFDDQNYLLIDLGGIYTFLNFILVVLRPKYDNSKTVVTIRY